MDKKYLDRLREDTRNDVESIENLTGLEIIVEIDSSRVNESADVPDTMACDVDEYTAKLIIPSQEGFSDPSVVHELLHIRRLLVDGVPRIVICDNCDDWSPQQETGLAKLDNQIEHLIIVPEELQTRPTRKSYWRSAMNRALLRLESGELPDHDVIQLVLIDWVFLHLVLDDSDLIDRAGNIIRQLDLAERAADYLETARSFLDSKEKLVRATFHYLGLAVDGVCLQTLVTGSGIASELKLSAVNIDR